MKIREFLKSGKFRRPDSGIMGIIKKTQAGRVLLTEGIVAILLGLRTKGLTAQSSGC